MKGILERSKGGKIVVLWTTTRLVRRKKRSALFYSLVRYHVGKFTDCVLGTAKTAQGSINAANELLVSVAAEHELELVTDNTDTTQLLFSESELDALRTQDRNWFDAIGMG